MPISVSGSQITFNDGSLQGTAATAGLVNKIINGSMMIDQRNAGASLTIPAAANTYTLDRWTCQASQASKFSVQRNAGAVTPPAGFVNYLGATMLAATTVGATDYFTIGQKVEGYNVSDLAWGTANAKTITLSFWVYSSLTGTFGGALNNAAGVRAYPFTYSVPVANTWTQISLTIPGDTTGTWVTDNSNGLTIFFSLGMGSTYAGAAGSWSSGGYNGATGAVNIVSTNGATFYITGVDLRKGSTGATDQTRDFRPYGTELALCQRYYYKITGMSVASVFASGFVQSSTQGNTYHIFPVTMRASPSTLDTSGTASDYQYRFQTTSVGCSSVPALADTSPNTAFVYYPVASGLTAGNGGVARAATTSAFLGFGAEL